MFFTEYEKNPFIYTGCPSTGIREVNHDFDNIYDYIFIIQREKGVSRGRERG